MSAAASPSHVICVSVVVAVCLQLASSKSNQALVRCGILPALQPTLLARAGSAVAHAPSGRLKPACLQEQMFCNL